MVQVEWAREEGVKFVGSSKKEDAHIRIAILNCSKYNYGYSNCRAAKKLKAKDKEGEKNSSRDWWAEN